MGTSSSIAIKTDKGIKGVYCHFDGYIENGVGAELIFDFNSEDKVNELVDLGSLSYIENGVACAYVRNKKEKMTDNNKPVITETYEEFLALNEQEFNYLFDGGKWFILDDKNVLQPLEILVKNDVATIYKVEGVISDLYCATNSDGFLMLDVSGDLPMVFYSSSKKETIKNVKNPNVSFTNRNIDHSKDAFSDMEDTSKIDYIKVEDIKIHKQ